MDDRLLSVAAHTIGHKTIEINNLETNNDNLIGEIENDGSNFTDTFGTVSGVSLYSGTGMVTDSGMAANDLQDSVSSLTFDSVASESEVSNDRQLVVVSAELNEVEVA